MHDTPNIPLIVYYLERRGYSMNTTRLPITSITTRTSTAIICGALYAGAALFVAAPHAYAVTRTTTPSQAGTSIMGPMITQHAIAGSYRVVMSIGPIEKMYTQAEYRKQHPTHGELILSGAGMMGNMHGAGMSMFAPHHLEIHVYNAHSGNVVTNARVSITVTDLHTKRVIVVPVMTMEGIGEGVRDFHYGNTVMLMTEHYRVGVTINGTRASFVVNWHEPSSGM